MINALHKMKCGNLSRKTELHLSFLRRADSVVDWFVRIFNVWMAQAEVPED